MLNYFNKLKFKDYHVSVFQKYGSQTRETRLKVEIYMADPISLTQKDRSLKCFLESVYRSRVPLVYLEDYSTVSKHKQQKSYLRLCFWLLDSPDEDNHSTILSFFYNNFKQLDINVRIRVIFLEMKFIRSVKKQ